MLYTPIELKLCECFDPFTVCSILHRDPPALCSGTISLYFSIINLFSREEDFIFFFWLIHHTALLGIRELIFVQETLLVIRHLTSHL